MALLVYGVFGIYFVYWAWDNVDWRLRAALVVGHLFVTLWMIVLVRAVAWTTMAGAIAGWFVAPAVHTHCARPWCTPIVHTPLRTPITTKAGAIAGWCVKPSVHTHCAHPSVHTHDAHPSVHTPLFTHTPSTPLYSQVRG